MDEVLVVFYKNLSEIGLSFVVCESKLTFFVQQILNFRIAFILGGRKYSHGLSSVAKGVGAMGCCAHLSLAGI